MRLRHSAPSPAFVWRKTQLLRQRSALQLQLSEAASLLKIDQRASALGLRPMTPDQAHYVTIATPATADDKATR